VDDSKILIAGHYYRGQVAGGRRDEKGGHRSYNGGRKTPWRLDSFWQKRRLVPCVDRVSSTTWERELQKGWGVSGELASARSKGKVLKGDQEARSIFSLILAKYTDKTQGELGERKSGVKKTGSKISVSGLPHCSHYRRREGKGRCRDLESLLTKGTKKAGAHVLERRGRPKSTTEKW